MIGEMRKRFAVLCAPGSGYPPLLGEGDGGDCYVADGSRGRLTWHVISLQSWMCCCYTHTPFHLGNGMGVALSFVSFILFRSRLAHATETVWRVEVVECGQSVQDTQPER